MKFNVAYVKQHPTMFVVFALVFGLGFWLLLSRKSTSGSTTVTTVGSGTDPNQVAANAQIQMASIQANMQAGAYAAQVQATNIAAQRDIAIATIQAQTDSQGVGVQRDLGLATVQAQLAAVVAQTSASVQQNKDSNQAMVDYARTASDAATMQAAITANALIQTSLGQDQVQLQLATDQTAIALGSSIASLHGKRVGTRAGDIANMLGMITNKDNGNWSQPVTPIASLMITSNAPAALGTPVG